MYALLLKESNGKVSDTWYYDTLKEAQERIEFYNIIWFDRNLKYKIVKANKNYVLIFKTPEGFITDKLYYGSIEEAVEDLNFYEDYYSDRNYKLEIKEEYTLERSV